MGEALQNALSDRYDALSTSLRNRVVQFVLDAFDSLGGYRDADAAVFVEHVLPTVLAAQAQMGQITDAYLSAMIADMLGGAAAPTGVALDEALRGVDPAEVYRRPFVTTWTALSQGKAYAQAVDEGRTRLLSITETDMQLARTHAARQSMQRGGARYFRRALRGPGNCALCTIASTQRYRVENLMPIHPGCNCKPEPIVGNKDPGQIIDERLLREAHDAVAKTVGQSDTGGRTPDYRQVIITREHGEYGPLLAVRRHEFTGPSDVSS
ncbi:head maturation protease [Streptomyces phage SF1]|uniref:Capsid maturation protease n=2 Tax=Caudoviricetes TaxID=2731619 RepID=A0A0K1Y588_9CAUD|nr:hypothetical protein [Streptomyces sp. SPB78]YP_009199272.1 head maturation protease [Streptomyces phage SF1]YP_009213131.1 head maturation protease [Streptomyces phage SF3]AKY02173.1 hypothetical protein SF1_240 [Streptomyces phage SF1]ALF00135.1 hypothetical protein SF3_40 [Streptomyces phage SF3]EFL00588.1 conserved hypothetical protein [Streptomyces sp. SPB78]